MSQAYDVNGDPVAAVSQEYDVNGDPVGAATKEAKPKPSSMMDHVRSAVQAVKHVAKSMFPRTSADLENPTDPLMPVSPLSVAADVGSGVGTAISHLPGMETLGKAEDWVQKKLAGPGQDYPLQNDVFQPAIDRLQEMPYGGVPAHLLQFIGQSASRPSTWAAGLGELSRIPAVARAAQVVGKLPESLVTSMESGLTRKPVAALREASTAQGRAGLHAIAGKEGDIARQLTDLADNPKVHMPEVGRIDEALKNAPDIDIRPTLEAFDKATPNLIGPMEAGTPGLHKVRGYMQSYKSLLQGKLPDMQTIADMDFAGNLDEAKAAVADPASKWGQLNEIATRSAANAQKAATRAAAANKAESITVNQALSAKDAEAAASRAALAAKAGESQAAGRALAGKSSFEFPGGASFENPGSVASGEAAANASATANTATAGAKAAAQASGVALTRAKKTAAIAQEAMKDANAKAATGRITAEDLSGAKRELDAATSNVHTAEAANEFSQGKTLDEVSRTLVDKHGLSGESLQNALRKGRQVVADNSFTPAEISSKVSAPDFKRLRELLDSDIDWNDPASKSLKAALKGPRTQMKQALVDAAGPQYAEDMAKWSDKIGTFNELNARLGKVPSNRLNRAVNLVKNAHQEGNADLLNELDQHTAAGISDAARKWRLAEHFTERARGGEILNPAKAGKPSWRPAGGLGTASIEAGGIGTALHYAGLPPHLAAALDAAIVGATMPAVAVRAIQASRIPPYLLRAAANRSPELAAILSTDQGNQ